MEGPVSSIESLFERIEVYVKTTLELSKLRLLEASIRVITAVAARLTVLVFIFLFALIFNLGIALWLGDLLGKVYYGFFIVAGFYLLFGIIFHFFLHGWIKGSISRLIINQVLYK